MNAPFRSGKTPTACIKCGAASPDMLGPNGDLLCKGCAMTAEADVRLAAGKEAGRTGAIMAMATGSLVIVVVLLFVAAAGFEGRGVVRIGTIVGMFGALVLAAGIRNYRNLKPR